MCGVSSLAEEKCAVRSLGRSAILSMTRRSAITAENMAAGKDFPGKIQPANCAKVEIDIFPVFGLLVEPRARSINTQETNLVIRDPLLMILLEIFRQDE